MTYPRYRQRCSVVGTRTRHLRIDRATASGLEPSRITEPVLTQKRLHICLFRRRARPLEPWRDDLVVAFELAQRLGRLAHDFGWAPLRRLLPKHARAAHAARSRAPIRTKRQ
jgi:hypothetical protein